MLGCGSSRVIPTATWVGSPKVRGPRWLQLNPGHRNCNVGRVATWVGSRPRGPLAQCSRIGYEVRPQPSYHPRRVRPRRPVDARRASTPARRSSTTTASTIYDVTAAQRAKSYDLISAIDYDVNRGVNRLLSPRRPLSPRTTFAFGRWFRRSCAQCARAVPDASVKP